MAPIPNPRVIYKSIPNGLPVVGETMVYDASRTIDLEDVPLKSGFLTKTLVVSPEPWLRKRMRDPSAPDDLTAMRASVPFVSLGLVKVLRSDDPQFDKGDYLLGPIPWQAYTVEPWEDKQPGKPGDYPNYTTDVDTVPLYKIPKPQGFPMTAVVGILGVTGQTAYFGLKEYAEMKRGETIYVSAAAGAVGHLVVQFAKIAGLKVVASTGSDEKVKYLKEELNVDYAFNYKTTPVQEALSKQNPIDIYWDNVGGVTLETAIEHCAKGARIIACGYISEYNDSEAYGIKNLILLFKKRIHIHGLYVLDLVDKWMPAFLQEVPKLLMEGKLRAQETVVHGLENADKAFVDIFEGRNLGKSVVVVAEDD